MKEESSREAVWNLTIPYLVILALIVMQRVIPEEDHDSEGTIGLAEARAI